MNRIHQFLSTLSPGLRDELPRRVTTRELSRDTQKVLSALRDSQSTAVITYRGVPSFLLVPIDRDQLPALVLSVAPELFADDLEAADAALAAGDVELAPETDLVS